MRKFDTIVVGLGAMGSAAVYQLAKTGNRVLGIDRFSPPHEHGSSHGDTRITRLAIGEGAHYTPIVRRSHEIWREIERATDEELFVVSGELIISSGAASAHTHVDGFFQNTIAAAKAHDVPHELLDASAMRARFPQFRVDNSETGYFEPDAGFLRVDACLHTQLKLAEKYGAEIHPDEKAMTVHSRNGVVTVETEKSTYEAPNAILAVGAWIPDFADDRWSSLFRIFRQTLHWFDIERSAEAFAPGRFPVFIWEPAGSARGLYGFPAADGPLGGIKVASERYDEPTTADSMDPGPDDAAKLYRELIAPHLPGVGSECLRSETCLYTVTPDAGFVIDRHPDMDNVIVASACSGHGFKHSAAIGEALAQLATRGASRLDMTPFRLERFFR